MREKGLIKITSLNIIIGITFFSCISFKHQKKAFTAYSQKLVNKSIKTNGVYVQKDSFYNDAFYFYKNGLVKSSIIHSEFWKNPAEKVTDVDDIYMFSSKEYWGHYVFKSDTLIIQLLNTAGGHLPRRRLIEYKAIINDDSTFTYFSMRGFQGRTRILDPKIKYGFFPTNIKPDSTNIWFYDKEWYKENLHESRKK